jgi:hypothetical protein
VVVPVPDGFYYSRLWMLMLQGHAETRMRLRVPQLWSMVAEQQVWSTSLGCRHLVKVSQVISQ